MHRAINPRPYECIFQVFQTAYYPLGALLIQNPQGFPYKWIPNVDEAIGGCCHVQGLIENYTQD